MDFEWMGPVASGVVGGAFTIVLCDATSRCLALVDAAVRCVERRRHRAAMMRYATLAGAR